MSDEEVAVSRKQRAKLHSANKKGKRRAARDDNSEPIGRNSSRPGSGHVRRIV